MTRTKTNLDQLHSLNHGDVTSLTSLLLLLVYRKSRSQSDLSSSPGTKLNGPTVLGAWC